MAQQIATTRIRLDGGTQLQHRGHDAEHIDSLIAAIENGDELPPIVVFHDGTDYWIADGFHRWQAHQKAAVEKIRCDIREGTLRDAQLYAWTGANRDHGRKLTIAERRERIENMLGDDEWCKLSNREIAKKCGSSRTFVGSIRAKLGVYPDTITQARTDTDGHVQVYKTPRRTKPQKQPQTIPPPPPPAPMPEQDGHGRVIPKAIRSAFLSESLPSVAGEIDTAKRNLQAIARMIEAIDQKDGVHVPMAEAGKMAISIRGMAETLGSIGNDIGDAKPYAICPLCDGIGCDTCNKSGFLTSTGWSRIPEGNR